MLFIPYDSLGNLKRLRSFPYFFCEQLHVSKRLFSFFSGLLLAPLTSVDDSLAII